MDDKSYIDLIELLKQKLKQEEGNYEASLKAGKQFWELKEIRKKIHQLQTALEKHLQIDREKRKVT